MTNFPYGTTTYCDDIRHEINGKISLIGCYSSELNFLSPAPGALNGFGAVVNIRLPIRYQGKNLKLSIVKEDGGERVELLGVDIELPVNNNDEVDQTQPDALKGEELITSITIPCQLQRLEFKSEGYVKTRAYIDDEEIRLGVLKVNFPKKMESNGANPGA